MKITVRLFAIFGIAFLISGLAFQFVYMPHAIKAWQHQQPVGEISIYLAGESQLLTKHLLYLASALCGLASLLLLVITKSKKTGAHDHA